MENIIHTAEVHLGEAYSCIGHLLKLEYFTHAAIHELIAFVNVRSIRYFRKKDYRDLKSRDTSKVMFGNHDN